MHEDPESEGPVAPAPDTAAPLDPAPADRESGTTAEIARLSAMVDQLQRRPAAPAQAGDAAHEEIIRRLERLESWVTANRLP